jgi:plasmid stability protein
MAQNITLSLDEEALRQARVAAARRGLSLSALLREQLTRLGEQDEHYEAAHKAAVDWMERGASLGVGDRRSRDALHDRDALR